MKLTLIERLRVYESLLDDWTNAKTMEDTFIFKTNYGFCNWFNSVVYTKLNLPNRAYEGMLLDFPEMKLIETTRGGFYWYPRLGEGRKIRIEMIQRVIRYTKYLLLLDMMEENASLDGAKNWYDLLFRSDGYSRGGFCSMVRYITECRPVFDVMEQLPELRKFKPHHYYKFKNDVGEVITTAFWWKPFNYTKRTEAVKKAIGVLKKETKLLRKRYDDD